MNAADDMFCGECGWQLMHPDTKSEVEKAIVTTRPEKKGKPAHAKVRPEGEPAGGEPEPEPGPAGSEEDLEPEPAVTRAAPEAGPETADAGQDVLSEPVPWALSVAPKTLYEEGAGYSITESAAIVGERIYAWADINAVSMEASPASRLPSLFLAAFGSIILVLAATSYRRDAELGLILGVGGLLVLAIGAVLVVTARDQYTVCVQTASGAEAALVSTDSEQVERVVQAVRRGLDHQELSGLD
jgi:hypothetical protein